MLVNKYTNSTEKKCIIKQKDQEVKLLKTLVLKYLRIGTS